MMRTTIDVPELLLRRAKAAAAIRGIPLKDLFASILDSGLRSLEQESSRSGKRGQKRPIPVVIHADGPVLALSNADLEDLLLRADIGEIGLG